MLRSVENRSKWLLHGLDSFVTSENSEFLKEYDFRVSNDDKILGIYKNYIDEFKDIIIITNLGLYLGSEGKWAWVEYKLMKEIIFPLGGKEKWTYLKIYLKNGEEFNLPIKNRTPIDGTLSNLDIYAFEKFIGGIIMGLQSENNL